MPGSNWLGYPQYPNSVPWGRGIASNPTEQETFGLPDGGTSRTVNVFAANDAQVFPSVVACITAVPVPTVSTGSGGGPSVTPDIVTQNYAVFGSSPIPVPIPPGVTSGMLLLIAIGFANAQSSFGVVTITGHTSTTPWTSFGPIGTDTNKYAFYKIADAGDVADSAAGGLSWNMACSDGFVEQWAIAGWSGVNTTTPFAVTPAINNGSTTTWSWSNVTATATSVWVGLLVMENNSGGKTDPGPPPTKQIESMYQSGSSGFFGPGVIYSSSVSAGTVTMPTGTEANGYEWATIATILNPAGGGGGGATVSPAAIACTTTVPAPTVSGTTSGPVVLQTWNGNTPGSAVISAAPSNNLTAGSKIICVFNGANTSTGHHVISADDGNGNAFSQIDHYDYSYSGQTGINDIWVLDTPTGDVGTKPTFHLTYDRVSSSGMPAIWLEVSGLAAGATAAACFDTASSAVGHYNGTVSGTASPVGPPSYVSSRTGEFLLYFVGDGWMGFTTWSAPAGYTAASANWQNATTGSLLAAYKSSTGGTETGQWSWTGGGTFPGGLTLVAFKVPTSGSATVTPASISCTTVVPAPTILAGQGRTLSPPVISGSTTITAPTVQTASGATLNPVVIASTTTVPIPQVNISETLAPSTISIITAVPAAPISISTTISPVTIAGITTTPAPQVNIGETLSPIIIAGLTTVLTPTVQTAAGATLTPNVISGITALPAPTVTAGISVTVSPVTIAGNTAVSTPALRTDRNSTPVTLAGSTAISLPVVTITSAASPGTITGTTAVPAPVINLSATVTPVTISCSTVVPIPTVQSAGNVTLLPVTVQATTQISAPSIHTSAIINVATIAATTAVLGPNINLAINISPVTINAVTTVAHPTIITDSIIQTATISAITTLPAPQIITSDNLQPITVVGLTVIPQPTIIAIHNSFSAQVFPVTILGFTYAPPVGLGFIYWVNAALQIDIGQQVIDIAVDEQPVNVALTEQSVDTEI